MNGECEVRSESNAKLQIVVNEGAATVKAKATLQGQGQQPKSPKCNRVSPQKSPKCSNRTAGGSESHSDVGSSCSDEVGEDEEEEDEDTTRRRRDQGGDSVAFEII